MGRQEQETALYDQPELDLEGTADGQLASLAPKGRPKLSKKAKRHVEHHRGMNYEVTPAQTLMRKEMAQPVSLAQALGELVGQASQADPEVQAQALAIIDAAPSLQLTMYQWQIVQGMIEAGVMLGLSEGARQVLEG